MPTYTATTNSRGEFTFTNLPEGRYKITPQKRHTWDSFRPDEYELDVDHNISQLYFYVNQMHGLLSYIFGGYSSDRLDPPGPKKDTDTDGTYNVTGKVTLWGYWNNMGLRDFELEAEYLGSLSGEDDLPEPEPPRPEPSIRVVPSTLLAHKKSVKQHTCYCWAVFPEVGDPEAFTSLDHNITLPEYTSLPGEDDEVFTTPTMTYKSANGVMTTTIPTRLDLGKDGIEVTVLGFDRDKLLRQHYRNAEFEVFEINYRGDLSERIVWASGILGEATVGDVSASISLSLWTDVANRQLGRDYSALCDVGRLNEFQGEEFGTGRCRNQVLNDGPAKDDWTVEATVSAVDSDYGRMKFTLTHGNSAITDVTLNAHFDNHLAQGKVLFMTGDNTGMVRDIKAGDGDGFAGVDIELHVPLPFTPAIGDTLHLTVGCRRTEEDCKFFGNYANYRGFVIPGRDAVMRRFS